MAASFDWYWSCTPGGESGNIRQLRFKYYVSANSAARRGAFWFWLSDSVGAGITGTVPSTLTWVNSASQVVWYSATNRKHYLLRGRSTGTLSVNMGYGGAKTWYINTVAVNGLVRSQSVTFA